MRGPSPAFSTAATESPPPMIVIAPPSVAAPSASATEYVPLAKAANSKTPCAAARSRARVQTGAACACGRVGAARGCACVRACGGGGARTIGPFHTTVRHWPSASLNSAIDAGPMSRPIHPSGIASTLTICDAASASNLSATTTSVGSRNLTPLASAFRISWAASGTNSSSTMLAPTLLPKAL